MEIGLCEYQWGLYEQELYEAERDHAVSLRETSLHPSLEFWDTSPYSNLQISPLWPSKGNRYTLVIFTCGKHLYTPVFRAG